MAVKSIFEVYENRDLENFAKLVQDENVDVNVKNEQNQRLINKVCLDVACGKSDIEYFNLLLERDDIKLNYENENSIPLLKIIFSNQEENTLSGEEFDLQTKEKNELWKLKEKMLKTLLKRKDFDVNRDMLIDDKLRYSICHGPLPLAINLSGKNANLLKLVLKSKRVRLDGVVYEAGVSDGAIHYKQEGFTAIEYACKVGEFDAADLLIENGAVVTYRANRILKKALEVSSLDLDKIQALKEKIEYKLEENEREE